jgi:hypothetical protein
MMAFTAPVAYALSCRVLLDDNLKLVQTEIIFVMLTTLVVQG